MLLSVILDVLRKSGYLVYGARSVAGCVEVFKAHGKEIDLALVDVMIGRESGFDLADILERDFRFFRYVFMTAYFWEENTLKQLLRRGKPYFEKPLKFDEDILPFLKKTFPEGKT